MRGESNSVPYNFHMFEVWGLGGVLFDFTQLASRVYISQLSSTATTKSFAGPSAAQCNGNALQLAVAKAARRAVSI